MKPLQDHKEEIEYIASQIKTNHSKKKIRFVHGSTNSTRTKDWHTKYHCIDISSLNQILGIGKDYVVTEPSVPMDKLVRETLRHGLLPPVVMEFPGITVGGLFKEVR